MAQKYPQWIDEYARSVHKAISTMTPGNYGPVDFIELLRHLNGTFGARVYEAIKSVEKKGISIEDVAKAFPSASGLRMAFYFLVLEYGACTHKNKEQARFVFEYLLKILKSRTHGDTFAHHSNITHSPETIQRKLSETSWNTGDPVVARELGKLYNSFFSLSYSLYRDFFPQEANEISGPYSPTSKFANSSLFLVKEFTKKIRPVELWPDMEDFPYTSLEILQIYNDVTFVCELIGSHTIYTGDLMEGLEAWAVIVNGKEESNVERIKEITDAVAERAAKQAAVYSTFSREDLKLLTLKWLLYEFFDFFKLADLDWNPTEEMIAAVKGKNIPERLYFDTFPAYEEYVSSRDWEVYWLKDLYID